MPGIQPNALSYDASYAPNPAAGGALIMQPYNATPQYLAHAAAFAAATQATRVLHEHGRMFPTLTAMAEHGRRTYDALQAAWLGMLGVSQPALSQPGQPAVLLASPTSAHAKNYRRYV